MLSDIRSRGRGLGFLTIVAAPSVFGSQLDLQMGQPRLAAAIWVGAAVLGAVMTYGLLAVLIGLWLHRKVYRRVPDDPLSEARDGPKDRL